MFYCRACTPIDAAAATVKVDTARIVHKNFEDERENPDHRQQLQQKVKEVEEQEIQRLRDERERQEREERALKEKAEAERLAALALAKEQERREAQRIEEMVRREREAQAYELRKEAALAAAQLECRRYEEERQRELEASRRAEREQREKELQLEQELAEACRVRDFLTRKGYGNDINGKRKTLRKFYHPLHDAVAERDAELVRILLEARADPTLRSSSGKTPLQRATKWNTSGELTKVCDILRTAELMVAGRTSTTSSTASTVASASAAGN
mmetsp:Transcript_34700/g.81015  ORF Transcript_34700/g.81015 Transcript_34700/m.81015 type:complete len:272 (-) Transcript_34700:155-970(-)